MTLLFSYRTGVIQVLLLLVGPLLNCSCHADITEIDAETLYNGIQSNFFDALIDVRTQGEWDAGRISGAHLVESLANAGTSNEITNYTALVGCEYCKIAIYCRSGSRAGTAALHLQANGFKRLYNGGGTSQWVEAGYPLVTDVPSIQSACTYNVLTMRACEDDYFNGPSSMPSVAPEEEPCGIFGWRTRFCLSKLFGK